MDEAVNIKVEPDWVQEPEDNWNEEQNGCKIENFAFVKCEEEDGKNTPSNIKKEEDESREEYSDSATPSIDSQTFSWTSSPADAVGTQSMDSITHNTEDTVEKNFPCPECGKHFAKRSYQARHTKLMHAEKYKHKCSDCGSGFSTQGNLHDHIKTHTGEKPFACTLCSRAFARKSDLRKHMFIHKGEDKATDAQIVVYSCTECDKSFCSKTVLREHMFSHEGVKPFSCTQCSSSFARRSYLSQHMLVHTRGKSYNCHTCGSSFTWKSNLQRHMLKHFEEEERKQENQQQQQQQQ